MRRAGSSKRFVTYGGVSVVTRGVGLVDGRVCAKLVLVTCRSRVSSGGLVPQRRVSAAVQGEEEDGLEEELHRGFSCDVGAVTVVTSQRRRGGQKVCTRSLHLTSVSRFESDQRLADRCCRAKVRRLKYTLTPRRACVLLRFLALTCLSHRSRLEK